MDFLWLHTCWSWTFKTDGLVDRLKSDVGDIVFFGANGLAYTTGNGVFEDAIKAGECVEETIDDIQNEEFEPEGKSKGTWNDVFQLYDLYTGNLYIR